MPQPARLIDITAACTPCVFTVGVSELAQGIVPIAPFGVKAYYLNSSAVGTRSVSAKTLRESKEMFRSPRSIAAM